MGGLLDKIHHTINFWVIFIIELNLNNDDKCLEELYVLLYIMAHGCILTGM